MMKYYCQGLHIMIYYLSGTALCWWASLPTQDKTTARLADKVGCSSSDSSLKTVNCLRDINRDFFFGGRAI